ncbi:MAG: dihydropteroate synthase [Bacteroidales bacterium]|nr:dihydropteroate synthase [Bacteroidales bacterium]
MGILNVTPDSFYDGGRHTTPDAILAHARQLLDDGADIIDIGVVSSRPGAILLSPDEEAVRLVPVVTLLRRELPAGTLLSVDTCYSLPASKAVEAGADMVNDISGGQLDPQMFPTIASLQVPYVLMHMRGTPATMQLPANTQYGNIVEDLADYFTAKLSLLEHQGVREVFLDPGFGFAKTLEQNHHLLHHLHQLVQLFPQHPFLIALSNKSMITRRLPSLATAAAFPEVPASEWGTLVLNTVALQAGASILRVHSPRPACIAVDLLFDN